MKKLTKTFEKLALFVSSIVGSPIWFVFSLFIVIIWFPSRIFFKSDELWHLMINTTTTILTFLMMSLLHASQSRWEKRIEQLETKQERNLKMVQKDTSQIAEKVVTAGEMTETSSVNGNREAKLSSSESKKVETVTKIV